MFRGETEKHLLTCLVNSVTVTSNIFTLSDVQIPRWDPRCHRGVYLGRSPNHAENVALVLNLRTGHITAQFHVVFDDNFETVSSTDTDLKITFPRLFQRSRSNSELGPSDEDTINYMTDPEHSTDHADATSDCEKGNNATNSSAEVPNDGKHEKILHTSQDENVTQTLPRTHQPTGRGTGTATRQNEGEVYETRYGRKSKRTKPLGYTAPTTNNSMANIIDSLERNILDPTAFITQQLHRMTIDSDYYNATQLEGLYKYPFAFAANRTLRPIEKP